MSDSLRVTPERVHQDEGVAESDRFAVEADKVGVADVVNEGERPEGERPSLELIPSDVVELRKDEIESEVDEA